jgi:hypothetical protein
VCPCPRKLRPARTGTPAPPIPHSRRPPCRTPTPCRCRQRIPRPRLTPRVPIRPS